MEIQEILAKETAKGIAYTGIEGGFGSVSCSTAGNYPSIGVSQWEGSRADKLLYMLENEGGTRFAGRTYDDILDSGDYGIAALVDLLESDAGKAAQLELLAQDCLTYISVLQNVPTLDDTRCMIYAAMWCPTNHNVVATFLRNRANNYNLRSLLTMRYLFQDKYYIAADVGERYKAGYANRAEITYQYVAGIDLTTPYGIPAYGEAGNGK